jgi:hypothetical protein
MGEWVEGLRVSRRAGVEGWRNVIAILIIHFRRATDPAPGERTTIQVELVALRQVAPRPYRCVRGMVLRVTPWHKRAPTGGRVAAQPLPPPMQRGTQSADLPIGTNISQDTLGPIWRSVLHPWFKGTLRVHVWGGLPQWTPCRIRSNDSRSSARKRAPKLSALLSDPSRLGDYSL